MINLENKMQWKTLSIYVMTDYTNFNDILVSCNLICIQAKGYTVKQTYNACIAALFLVFDT